jgi:Divergent InlB B-repeat domain/FG-GAP-like repeat
MIRTPFRSLMALAACLSLAAPLAWGAADEASDPATTAGVGTPMAGEGSQPGGPKSIICGLYLSGTWFFGLDPSASGGPRATVSGPAAPNDLRINNDSLSCYSPTGTLRLEYWIATNGNQPTFNGGPFIGTRIAIFPNNGQLSAGFSFININGFAGYTVPAYGTYWLVMTLAQYQPGVCGSADGFCYSDSYLSSQMITIGTNPLSVSTAGTGSGNVVGVVNSPAPTAEINCPASACFVNVFGGYTVTLTATPAAGSVFAGWSGACTGTAPCTISMAAARSVTATFNPAPVQTFALSVSITGSGSVSSSPGGISCGATCSANFNNGTVVSLTPNPLAGNVFGGWSGACTGTGACQVTMNAAKSVFATFNTVTIAGRRGDVNGDGKADLFWRQTAPSTGVSWWLMNGSTATSTNYFDVGSEWQIADVGDLNGDGKTDLIWRRTTDGAAYLWTLNGLTPANFFDLGILSPAVWTLVGAADINGDHKADLIWRHTDGTIYAWIMNGGTITAQGVVGNPGAQWQVIDLADMNGDGYSDIVFRNSTTGQVYFWYMNGLAIGGAASPGSLDPAQWTLLAAADFSGDGKADLLWRNNAGDTWVWVTNGAMASIGNPGLAWSVRAVADLDGDGKTDLVWRHTDGTTYFWKMNGAAVSAYLPISNPGGTWQVVAP